MPTGPQVPAALAAKAKQLKPGIPIELWIVDASMLFSFQTGLPGPIYYFHNMDKQGVNPLVFQSNSYVPVSMAGEGFEFSTGDKLPRPTLMIGNLGSVPYTIGPISALLYLYGNFTGAEIRRKYTLFEYLDNQPTADPTKEYPVEIWKIDSKTDESREQVAFELVGPYDVEGAMIPRGQILANACRRTYRSPIGCAYAGVPLTDEFGNSFVGPLVDRGQWDQTITYVAKNYVYTLVNGIREVYVAPAGAAAGLHPRYHPASWKKDVCLKSLIACDLRFSPGPLHTSAWPAISRAPIGST